MSLYNNTYEINSCRPPEMRSVFPYVTDAEKQLITDQVKQILVDPAWNEEYFDKILLEYLRFMQLKILLPYNSFHPCLDVSKVWHAHILCTRQYHNFCARFNGGTYIHHIPGLHSDNQSKYLHTLAAYRKQYGEPAPTSIWKDYTNHC